MLRELLASSYSLFPFLVYIISYRAFNVNSFLSTFFDYLCILNKIKQAYHFYYFDFVLLYFNSKLVTIKLFYKETNRINGRINCI